jgi:hypothetical protein
LNGLISPLTKAERLPEKKASIVLESESTGATCKSQGKTFHSERTSQDDGNHTEEVAAAVIEWSKFLDRDDLASETLMPGGGVSPKAQADEGISKPLTVPNFTPLSPRSAAGKSTTPSQVGVASVAIEDVVDSVNDEKCSWKECRGTGSSTEPISFSDECLTSAIGRASSPGQVSFAVSTTTKIRRGKRQESKRPKQTSWESNKHTEERVPVSSGTGSVKDTIRWWGRINGFEPLSRIFRLVSEVYAIFSPLVRRFFVSAGYLAVLLLKLVVLVVLGVRNTIKYAAAEAERREGALRCYLVLYVTPSQCDWMMAYISLPHYTPHILSSLALFWVCTPASPNLSLGLSKYRLSDDLCKLLLRAIRLYLPLAFVVEGFSNPNSKVMLLDDSTRLIMAYVLSLLRGGLVLSPVGWAGWSLQVMIAAWLPKGLIASFVLFFLGLALIRLLSVLHLGV